MEPITTISTSSHQDDTQLWGTRSVLWGLRMLAVGPQAMVESLSASERREAADFLGFELPADAGKAAAAAQLAARMDEVERDVRDGGDARSVLFQNLHGLQRQLNFDDVDLDVIAFRAMLRLHPGFEALAGKYVGLCCDFVFHRKLARVLGHSDRAIATALAPSGRLVKSGLVTVMDGVLGPLEHRLRLLSGLITPLVARPATPLELLQLILPASRGAHLDLAAYPHLGDETRLLVRHLKKALDEHAPGVNILLHGGPGTGKSEMAAALASALHCPLYPSQPAPEDGESLTPRERFRHLAQLQRLVYVVGNGIVLVDEAEDLFPAAWSDPSKTPTKAAVNEALETNPAPTIWISNRAAHMDEAFLRRFDLVIHVPPLPAGGKRSLLHEALPAGTLSDAELRQYATQRELSPAVIARMAKVAVCAASRDAQEARTNLEVLSSHYLQTLGAEPRGSADAACPLPHDPRLLNTDPPLDDVIQAMSVARFGTRMLLHGEPGTGKTAFCKALAEQLDRPLLQRQASSLLSCYVGDTEKNLREMFSEARRENGILLLDEADSFLRSRDQARARWEVTQTNELLTQMEAFEGTFICTTNRLSDMDPAALRRFDFKVEFQPLRPDQRVLLVRQCCAALRIDVTTISEAQCARARQLDGLTPGDAAAVLRRIRVTTRGCHTATVIDALERECRYKPSRSKPIGFLP